MRILFKRGFNVKESEQDFKTIIFLKNKRKTYKVYQVRLSKMTCILIFCKQLEIGRYINQFDLTFSHYNSGFSILSLRD